MEPSNNIGFLLNHLAFVLGRHSDQVLLEQLGIGFSQFKIMLVLKWKPQIRQKQIADDLRQTEASISRQIRLLNKKGLLASHLSSANKRVHITSLTSKGERLTERAIQILNDYHAPTFASLSPKQRKSLIEALTAMHSVMCADRQDTLHYL